MNNKAYQVSMEVAGNTAMWTRPDCGDSPCSYPAPTYSAVRSLFESVLWGPAIIIIPKRVELCTVPQFHSYVTNYGGPLRKEDSIKKGNNYQLFATILIDVCYRMYADVIPNPNKSVIPDTAKSWDQHTTSPGHAYQEIFNRRLQRGQSYATLCLGWSEFTPSYFGPLRETTRGYAVTFLISEFRLCCEACFMMDIILITEPFMIRIYVSMKVFSIIPKEVTADDQRTI